MKSPFSFPDAPGYGEKGRASELGPGPREDRGEVTGLPVSETPYKEVPTAKPQGSGRRLRAEGRLA